MSAVLTVDPATGERRAEYPAFSDADVDAALDRAAAAQAGWAALPFAEHLGIAVARRIRSGAAFVDAVVASDVCTPFGGTRASGYGREPAAAGIREFVDVRTRRVLDEPAVTVPASEWSRGET